MHFRLGGWHCLAGTAPSECVDTQLDKVVDNVILVVELGEEFVAMDVRRDFWRAHTERAAEIHLVAIY
jgi:hypothetical protein